MMDVSAPARLDLSLESCASSASAFFASGEALTNGSAAAATAAGACRCDEDAANANPAPCVARRLAKKAVHFTPSTGARERLRAGGGGERSFVSTPRAVSVDYYSAGCDVNGGGGGERSPRPLSDGGVCVSAGASCVALRDAVSQLYCFEDFERVEYLGEGFFSEVYKVRHMQTNEIMVLKMSKDAAKQWSVGRTTMDAALLSPIIASNRHRQKHSTKQELQLMRRLRHDNVLRFLGVCVGRDVGAWNLHALTEFCNAGSLSRLILDVQRPFAWPTRVSLCLDVARGMDYVHAQGFMHRDLTAMNVLLQETGFVVRAVVSDFGLSCSIPRATDPPAAQVGTPFWMAPECLKEERYNELADVFSYGVICCQTIARIDADPEKGFARTPGFGVDYVLFSEHCPDDTPTEFLRLAFSCCLMDPSSRPTFSRVVQKATKVYSLLLTSRRARRLPATVRPRADSQRALSRSVSDAGFVSGCSAASSEAANRSLAATPSHCRRTVDVPEETAEGSETACQERASWRVAQTVAAEDPYYEPDPDGFGNPFAEHDKYRDGRKIMLASPSPRDHIFDSPDGDDDLMSRLRSGLFTKQSTPIKRAFDVTRSSLRSPERRRCHSLPSSPQSAPRGRRERVVGRTPAKERLIRNFADTDRRYQDRRNTVIGGRRASPPPSRLAEDDSCSADVSLFSECSELVSLADAASEGDDASPSRPLADGAESVVSPSPTGCSSAFCSSTASSKSTHCAIT